MSQNKEIHKMRTFSEQELKDILDKHGKWLRNETGGERAYLSRANLSGANLSYADLSRANLSRANLSGADLSDADLSGADLSDANLSRANLTNTNLSRAYLSDVNLSGANLSGTKLTNPHLINAILSGSYPYNTDLTGGKLTDPNLNSDTVTSIKNVPPPQNEGIKYDADKVDMSLLSVDAMTEIAKVMTFGAKKYAPHNWRKGFVWSRVISALLRHIYAWISGEDKDPETGLSHLAHAGCCLFFLLEFEKRNVGTDDRFKYPQLNKGE